MSIQPVHAASLLMSGDMHISCHYAQQRHNHLQNKGLTNINDFKTDATGHRPRC